MRALFVAMLLVAGIGFVATSASAAPGGNTAMLNAKKSSDTVINVSGGCGRGWHRNWRGYCVRNWRGW